MDDHERATTSDDDSGLGMIELIVALLVSSIVLIAAASILVNSWLTQQDVTTTTQATNRGQLMGAAIERAMRNAKDLQVSPTDDNGTELRVWTSLGGDRTCQGFQLTTGTARIATSSGMLPGVDTWGAWQEGILQHDSSPFFERVGDTVAYSFEIETDSAPVPISGQAKMRSSHIGGASPCWP